MPEFKFTPEQRLIITLLCNLHREPSKRNFSDKDISLIKDAVCNGHDWAIEWEMGAMFPEEIDTDEQVALVTDILDMWDFIELSWDNLKDAEKQNVKNAVQPFREPKFIGFDGNNETAYLSISKMIVEDLGRFERFKGRSLDSHYPMIDEYQKKLTIWPAIRKTLDGTTMTPDQLIKLLS